METLDRLRELYYLRAFLSRALIPCLDTPLAWKAYSIRGLTRSGLAALPGQVLRFDATPQPWEFFRATIYAPADAQALTFQVTAKNLTGESLSSRTISLGPSRKTRSSGIILPLAAQAGQKVQLELSVLGTAQVESAWIDPGLLSRKPLSHLARRLLSLFLAGGVNDVRERWALGMAAKGSYQEWGRWRAASPATLEAMGRACGNWPNRPKLSLLLTDIGAEMVGFKTLLDSLSSQVYRDWELVIGTDKGSNPRLAARLDEACRTDRRIRVHHHDDSSNTIVAATTGSFVAWVDVGDELSPEALFEVAKTLQEDPELDIVYTDEDNREPSGRRFGPRFKPDWAPEYLRARNYIGRLSFFRRILALDAGEKERDLALKFIDQHPRCRHIPKVLYHRAGMTSQTPPAAALRYSIKGRPLVSILIPTAGSLMPGEARSVTLIEHCARIVSERTQYDSYEMIVFENGNLTEATRQTLGSLGCQIITYRYSGRFNYAQKMNFAVQHARGEHVVMLSDDVTPMNGQWLGALLEYSQQPDVGGVGARLYFPNGILQHVGVVLADKPLPPTPLHPLKGFPKDYNGYYLDSSAAHECIAVTGACFMSRKAVLDEVSGMDERLAISYNDIDLCLRIRQKGYRIIYTPHAELIHAESTSLGSRRMDTDAELFRAKWAGLKDPYYNPNLAPGDASCGLNWD